MNVDILTLDSAKAGTIDLPEGIFNLTPSADILHRMVVWQMAKQRQGTHKVKNRGEVKASTRKIQRQKGAGAARHGARSVNLMRGGGRAFGPTPRDHSIGLPKKICRLALKHALSAKFHDKTLLILDNLELDQVKTAIAAAMLNQLGVNNALIIDGSTVNRNFALSIRNLPNIDVLPAIGANVLAILGHDNLMLTRDALTALTKRLA